MPPIHQESVERIRRDHEEMLELAYRIKGLCTESDKIDNCSKCHSNTRPVCHGNIEQLVRLFVESTLKHNVIESIYMEGNVPDAHRIAHNRAHLAIAEQLKAIRLIFSHDGNCVLAISGIDQVVASLLAHFKDYDSELETHLLAPA